MKHKNRPAMQGGVAEADYFFFETAPNDHRGLSVVCGGYEQCAPDYDVNRNSYPYFFIKYTIAGEGILHTESKTLPLRAGVLTGFEPGTPHHYISDEKNPMSHIFFTFIGYECHQLFQKSTLSSQHYIEVADPDHVYGLFCTTLTLGKEKKEFSQDICCAYLRILLLEQGGTYSTCKTSLPASKLTFQTCKEYLDNSFSVIKSPCEVAEKCSIDVRYMSVLFKRYCNMSPSQYLMRLKLNKAANSLLRTDLSVKQIAFEVGFEDPYHFSKNFKKSFGVSPSHFRKNHF